MCFWLFHAQAFHEPAVLLRADLPCFPAVSGPLIYAALQTLIQKDKAVSLPVPRLFCTGGLLSAYDLADAFLREGDGDKVIEHLNEAFSIYDQMLPDNAKQLIYPYSTLANLLVALGDYETAITNYSHVIWLMLENEYSEESETVQEFAARVAEVRQMQDSDDK